LSCEEVKCNKMGAAMIFLEDKYCLWLCNKHYEEFINTHPRYIQWNDPNKKELYRIHK